MIALGSTNGAVMAELKKGQDTHMRAQIHMAAMNISIAHHIAHDFTCRHQDTIEIRFQLLHKGWLPSSLIAAKTSQNPPAKSYRQLAREYSACIKLSGLVTSPNRDAGDGTYRWERKTATALIEIGMRAHSHTEAASWWATSI